MPRSLTAPVVGLERDERIVYLDRLAHVHEQLDRGYVDEVPDVGDDDVLLPPPRGFRLGVDVVALDRGRDLRRVDRALVGKHAHRGEHEMVAVDVEKAP